MIVIHKTIEFSASHQLTRLAADHQCARLHGHNYTVEVELSGDDDLGELHMLVDYGALSAAIKGRFEHQHLNNDKDLGEQPTAELLAKVIARIVKWELIRPTCEARGISTSAITLRRVRVSETASSWAEWRE